MNCWEISSLLTNYISETKQYFRKCLYVSDLCQINSLIIHGENNIFIVLLNDGDGSAIGHFCLVFYSKDKLLVVFDSLGLRDTTYSLFNGLKSELNAKEIRYNTTQFQSNNSCVCGLYCIYIAVWLSTGSSFQEVLSRFSSTELWWNDKSIFEWFKRHFKYLTRFTKKQLLTCDL